MPDPTRAPDWPPGTSEMARLMRGHDWGATPLGPPETWSERLKVAVEMTLAHPLVSTLACGPRRALLYNDAASRLYGDRHPGVLGRPLAEGFPDSYPAVAALYDRAFAGEAVAVPVQPLDVSQEGGEVFEAYLMPVRDGAGRVLAVHMIGLEVGRRLAAERALIASEGEKTFLLRLSDALRPLADPATVQGEACRLLADHLDVERAYYVEVDEKAGIARVERDCVRGDAVSLAGEHRIADLGWSVAILRRGDCQVIPDTQASPLVPLADRPAAAALGIIACMGAPFLKAGRLVGALCVTDPRPRPWTAREVALLRAVGERIWADVQRARAEAALRAGEERFRAIIEAARDYAIFTTDAEGLIATWPPGAQEVMGWTAEEAVGRSMDMTFTPEDRLNGAPEKERWEARRNGYALDVRWHLRRDGSRVFIDGVTRPLTDPQGTVTGFVKVGQDVTERRATQEALRESEARFRQFGDASADVLWIRDAESLAFDYVSPAFEEIYGTPLDHVLDGNHVRRWAEMIVPEDREKVLDNLRRVREGEHVLQTFRILRSDGQVRWIRDTTFPLLDGEGRVQRIAGIGRDVTEEVEMQDRLRVLVAELQHRSRNLVSVVRGVSERTLGTSTTLEEFRERFLARLDALGRVNALLSRLTEGDRVTFDQLLRTELQAHGVTDSDQGGEQVSLHGPTGIRLRSASVQTFALALHELATNALKHGALARPEGRLEVSWALVPGKDDERRLRVDWRETGVPLAGTGDPDAGPGRQGYGRLLIERALPYQLQARTQYELGPDGVRCSILVPVSSTLDVAFSKHEDPEV